MEFSIKDFLRKCGVFLRIWLHLLKKSLMENFIFLRCDFPSNEQQLRPQELHK